MIEKLSFFTINGKRESFDHMVNTKLSKYEVHLENAITELSSAKSLSPFTSNNPYTDNIEKLKQYVEDYQLEIIDYSTNQPDYDVETINHLVEQINHDLESYLNHKDTLADALKVNQEKLELIQQFIGIDFPTHSIIEMKSVRFRFGRFTKENYQKFMHYIYDDIPSILLTANTDDEYVYGVYFAPLSQLQRVQAQYMSMNWERLYLPDEYEGTPIEASANYTNLLNKLRADYTKNEADTKQLLSLYQVPISKALHSLEKYSINFMAHKYAALTHEAQSTKETRYILCGWIASEMAHKFKTDLESDHDTLVVIQNDSDKFDTKPPSKLKNFSLFRPYEMFVKMYGLPNYQEFDPTSLVAMSYSFLFGAMFGDLGQGLVLAAFGYLLYATKKMALGGIIGLAGIWSAFFGLMYGSIFGFEEVIPALWLHPMLAMTQLPVIGSLNTVFVVSIAFGMFLIIATMVINMINKYKQKETGEALLDKNGLAGLLFYSVICLLIVLVMTGRSLPAGILLIAFIALPLIAMALKEPILNKLANAKETHQEGLGMFLVQSFFEIFEILLSFFSNTLSFVRVGAFAISHGAMMQVVLMLAGAESGNPNWLVVILGNLVIVAIEGLVVGIQVLRLQYYEIFSHFYQGNGKEFRTLEDERK